MLGYESYLLKGNSHLFLSEHKFTYDYVSKRIMLLKISNSSVQDKKKSKKICISEKFSSANYIKQFHNFMEDTSKSLNFRNVKLLKVDVLIPEKFTRLEYCLINLHGKKIRYYIDSHK